MKKSTTVKQPKKIHIRAVSDVLTIDETVPFNKSLQRLKQIRKMYLSAKNRHYEKICGIDNLKVTITSIF